MLLALIVGCGRATPQTQRSAKHPTVASLVPAATDLLLAMGAADHLVAVSNFEPPRPEIAALPKVGDYQSTDWEKLAELRPDVMVIFMSPAQTPPGLLQRAVELHIAVVNIQTNRLSDIFSAIDRLGAAVDRPLPAAELATELQQELDVVQIRAKGKPPIRTLLSLSDDRFDLVGPGSYLDEMLTIAGGENALRLSATPYPTLDREAIAGLSPSVVLQLSPDATPDWRARADQLWQSVPSHPRCTVIDDPFVLQPGAHIGAIAEKMFDALHRE